MLRFAVIFAILALVAGFLGFGNMAGDFAYIAKILLFVFLVLFVVALVLGRGGGPAVQRSRELRRDRERRKRPSPRACRTMRRTKKPKLRNLASIVRSRRWREHGPLRAGGLESPPGRPDHRGGGAWPGCSARPRCISRRGTGVNPTSPPGAIRSGASGSCSSAASTSRPQTTVGRVDRHGPPGHRRRHGGALHGERGILAGRTLLAEARRVQFRDGRPPGPLQLVAARAGVDPRGPRQDHPGQAARRHHPRRPRRDRPARQAGRRRPSTTSTSSRATRPTRSSCAGPRCPRPIRSWS